MNQDLKLNQLFDRLLDGTLKKEFHWVKLSKTPYAKINRELLNNLPDQNHVIHINSYWFENQKNIVGLISTIEANDWILMFNKQSNHADFFPIPRNKYFDLKIAIENRYMDQIKLIDDFLDS